MRCRVPGGSQRQSHRCLPRTSARYPPHRHRLSGRPSHGSTACTSLEDDGDPVFLVQSSAPPIAAAAVKLLAIELQDVELV